MPALSRADWLESLRRILVGPELGSSTFDRLLDQCPSLSIESTIEPHSRVLIRGDIDVPLDKTRKSVLDNERLKTLREIIDLCTQLRAIPVILGHVGRDPENTSAPLVHELENLYRQKCTFVSDWLDTTNGTVPRAASKAITAVGPGELILLEQTRKHDIERFLWGKSEADLASIPDYLFESARAVAEQIASIYVFDAIGSHNPDWSCVVLPGAMQEIYLGPFSRRELAGPMATIRNANIVVLSGLKTDKLDAIEAVVNRAPQSW